MPAPLAEGSNPVAMSRLDDLAATVASARERGQTPVNVETDRLADWLAGWRADRARILDAEENARAWKRRARRHRAGPRRAGARGGR